MAQTISLKFVIDSKGAVSGAELMVNSLEKVQIEAKKAGTQAEKLENKTKSLGGRMGKLGSIAHALGLSLASAFGVVQFVKVVDQMKLLENRMRIVTRTTSELNDVQRKLAEISVETRSDLVANSDLFARLALSTKGQGVATKQLLDLTRSLNQAIVLSGATAREAEAGLIQLSQGLASGTLRGDELRSVLEQLPAVADVIARSLGVTRGKLREMGTEGAITAQVVLEAFEKLGSGLQADFDTTSRTVGQALLQLKTGAIKLAVAFDKSVGATKLLKEAIDGLRKFVAFLKENLGILKATVSVLTASLITFSIVSSIRVVGALARVTAAAEITTTGFIGFAQSVLFARGAMQAFIASTGIGIAIVVITELAIRLFSASTSFDDLSDSAENSEDALLTASSTLDLAALSAERFSAALKEAEVSGGSLISRLEVVRSSVEKLQDQMAVIADDSKPKRISDKQRFSDISSSLVTPEGNRAFELLKIDDQVLSDAQAIAVLKIEIKALANAEKELNAQLKEDPFGSLDDSIDTFLRSSDIAAEKIQNQIDAQQKLNSSSKVSASEAVAFFNKIKSELSEINFEIETNMAIGFKTRKKLIEKSKSLKKQLLGQSDSGDYFTLIAKKAKEGRDEVTALNTQLEQLKRTSEEVRNVAKNIVPFDSSSSNEELKKSRDSLELLQFSLITQLTADTQNLSTASVSQIQALITLMQNKLDAFQKDNDKKAGVAGARAAKAFAKGFSDIQTDIDKFNVDVANVGKSRGAIEDDKLIASFKKKSDALNELRNDQEKLAAFNETHSKAEIAALKSSWVCKDSLWPSSRRWLRPDGMRLLRFPSKDY